PSAFAASATSRSRTSPQPRRAKRNSWRRSARLRRRGPRRNEAQEAAGRSAARLAAPVGLGRRASAGRARRHRGAGGGNGSAGEAAAPQAGQEAMIRTLADISRHHAAERPDQVAISFQDRDTTYGALDRLANRVANGLIALGVKPGARIAHLDKNHDSFFAI